MWFRQERPWREKTDRGVATLRERVKCPQSHGYWGRVCNILQDRPFDRPHPHENQRTPCRVGRVDLENLIALRDRTVRTFRLARPTVNAFIGNVRCHENPPYHNSIRTLARKVSTTPASSPSTS